MIQTVSVNPSDQPGAYTVLRISGKAGSLAGFPLLSIDRDSYVVQAEIQSGINFRLKAGCHCIAIGRGCSLADGITLMIDLNHNYRSVSQGHLHFLQGVRCVDRIARKGTIIIQNDVWVGHGAMIMAGVTLHNGCIVAAGAVVTKDVHMPSLEGIPRRYCATDLMRMLSRHSKKLLGGIGRRNFRQRGVKTLPCQWRSLPRSIS